MQNAIKGMSRLEYQALLKNMKFHDLTTFRKAPAGLGKLLGLSLSFCLQSPRPNQDIDLMMSRLRDDVRRKAFFCGQPENENNYNPKIYIKSDWKPPEANEEIEDRLDRFESEARKLQNRTMRHPKQTNITRQQWTLMNDLKKSNSSHNPKLGLILVQCLHLGHCQYNSMHSKPQC